MAMVAQQPTMQAEQSTQTIPTVTAEQPQPFFGYFSYQTVLSQMPDYEAAQRSLQALRGKYAAELQRVEDDFRVKYEQFLEGQRDFAPSIRQKRQAELQELMQKNAAFRQDTERLLKQAERDALAPVKERLAAAVQRVGQSHQLAFILNTDAEATPYVNTLKGMDVTQAVLAALR